MAEPVATFTRNGTIPDKVTLRGDELRVAFTPRELAAIRQHFGRPWSVVMSDEDSDDKFVVLAWLKLRRDGSEVPIDAMLDVVIEMVGELPAMQDPTKESPPTISPPSAATGE